MDNLSIEWKTNDLFVTRQVEYIYTNEIVHAKIFVLARLSRANFHECNAVSTF